MDIHLLAALYLYIGGAFLRFIEVFEILSYTKEYNNSEKLILVASIVLWFLIPIFLVLLKIQNWRE